ncbi:hypothetical protein A1O3_06039 [Capronia epimyces CBS 606.96]|uniref:Uncharacterized protein n=1 Tax=Capronia epimyces CBS 606.96 TaxID=1182542 RepID=W9XZ22_9EURO|nr:uncharacterized protein A1O3_06039 [Capronia epimyces CBS 606.96]EXJ82226.1 hypothetical protein A1O3_06039 [Capronia epimyces CBS 606.96]
MLTSSLKRLVPLAAILLIIGYFTYVYDDKGWSLPRFGDSLGGFGATATASARPLATDTGLLQSVPSKGDSKAFPPEEPSQPSPPKEDGNVPPPKDKPNQSPPKDSPQGHPQPLPPSQGDSNSKTSPSEQDAPFLSSNAAPAKFPSSYREVFSVSRSKGNYLEIEFPGYKVFNPNILPHPTKPETWIVVAQKERGGSHDDFEAIELVCEAVFKDETDSLTCSTTPAALPVKSTKGGLCKGELEWFNGVSGPHDARVFYGPKDPYIIYGSRSGYTCFGQWIQDFRGLLTDKEKDKEEGKPPGERPSSLFTAGTELHRPGSFGVFEKNWFVFWDKQGLMYAHYDLAPRRSFAQLNYDGSVVGDDLAGLATTDEACMAKYMPQVSDGEGKGEGAGQGGSSKSSLHQATNSLSITLCNRVDASCKPNDDNTFIMSVFQQKFYYAYHNVYRPYVVLFRPTAPFAIYAISQKPLWFHGHRKVAAKGTRSVKRGDEDEKQHQQQQKQKQDQELPENQAEMFFVTSISWKPRGQTYHGYLDDVMFLTFGIEDNRAGAIDVRAGDLLLDLGVCG